MNRALRLALVAVLTLSALAAASVPSTHWSKVREALSKGLPKTALVPVESVIADAEARHAWPEAIRAITVKIALEAGIEGNKPEEKITRMQAAIAQSPREMRPVMEAILADWYWQYFQQNRWRFSQRTAIATDEATDDATGSDAEPDSDFTTWDLRRLYAEIDRHFSAALSAASLLQRIPIAEYDQLFEHGTAPDEYRPTLYDFVVFEALQFQGSPEQAGAKPEDAFVLQADSPVYAPRDDFMRWPVAATDTASAALKAVRLYQELMHFHALDRDRTALIDADLWRIDFAHTHAVGAANDTLYAAALERVAAADSSHELSARALHSLATLRNQQGDAVAARALAQRGLDRFPESVGGRRCFNLIAEIEAKSLSLNASDNVWNTPAPILDVTYRNLDRVYFRLVPYDFEELANQGKLPSRYGIGGVEVAELLRRTGRREWSVSLPPTPDFKARTERVPVPSGLPAGCYYLVSSARRDFSLADNSVAVTAVWISDLALVLRDGRPSGCDGFLLEALDGAPVPDAEVRTWARKPRYDGIEAGPTVRTDHNGMFHLASTERIISLLATKGTRRVGENERFSEFRQWPERVVPRTLFFTDRALYRPGQDIQYKGICIQLDTRNDNYTTLPSREVRVTLLDPNGREVASRGQVTNANGSFSGSFTAPQGGLRGEMLLRADGETPGTASVRVEEYKRPRFLVMLEAPRVAPRLADRVEVGGRALAYTGAPVDGAQVKWRVMRDVRFPVWWGWRFWGRSPSQTGAQAIAHGEATTDAEGHFSVTFTALPDSAVSAEQEPTFQYTVTADVTDGTGETRSADRTVNVGYAALMASLSAKPWLEAAHSVAIAVQTATLDGRPQAANGTLKVVRLVEPDHVERAHEMRTDYEVTRRGEIVRRADTTGVRRSPALDAQDPAGWPEGAVVAERSVRTDTLGADTVSVRLAAGHYRAHFETHDRFGKRVTAVVPLRVLDPGAPRFGLRVRDLFAARETSVEPGGEFLALWGTGYATAHAYIEVECRGQLLQSYWTTPGQTQATIRQPVTEVMRGGFTVRVTRVAENRAYLHEQHVVVPWTDRELDVRWEHFVSKLQPGRHETWTAIITGPDAARASAEMVATLYDASLDAFAPFDWTGIQGFRTNRDERYPQFHAGPTWFQPVSESWSIASRDGSLQYRTLPSGLLWGDYTYGFEDLRDLRAKSVSGPFKIAGAGPLRGMGRLAGHVSDSRGKPVAYATISVVGAKQGAVTDPDGAYIIPSIAPGRYQVRVQMLGYKPSERSVKIAAGKTLFLDLVLGGEIGVQGVSNVMVSAKRQLGTVTAAGATRRDLPVDNLAEAVAMKSGVVADGEDLHFRGGRGGETKLTVDGAGAAHAPKLDAVIARSDLRETAFFYPHLLTNAKGEVRIEFTAPEALTEWRFMAFAHDRRLRSGTLSARAVTSKDLMVQPNPPRFLREGDEIEFTVKVTNQAATPQRGKVRLQFTHAADDSRADASLGNRAPELPLALPARGSHTYSWRIRVPDGAGVLRYKAVAATAKLSDGEEGWLPVLSRRVLVTESLPLPIRGPATRTFDFEHLLRSGESSTLQHQALTVQVVSNPAWYAVMALPYLMEYPYECTEQTFNRLYANTLARHIANSHPSIRATFEQWRGTPALDSPLEKNEQLKSVLISETPWLRQAKAESQARRNVGILFDRNRLDYETERLIAKLAAMQLPSGMWPWFPGGPPNEYITLYITTGFGRLRHLGVDLPTDAPDRSLGALDSWIDRWYRDLRRRGQLKSNNLSPTVALYLYGRSFFIAEQPIPSKYREALDYWLGQARAHWLETPDRQTRGHLALALQRFGDPTTAKTIMRSVKEYSVSNEEMGMFWRDTEYSWWWYRAPIETQALMIEAFDEVMGDSAAVEDCRVWLLKQKQTQDWKTTKATADAVYALLLRGTNILASKALVEVTLGDSLVRPESVEAGTGFYEKRFDGSQVRADMGRVKLVKADAGVAWGSVHWQYLEDMDKVPPYAGTPLKLEKRLFVRSAGKAGLEIHPVAGPIHPGDELVVRIELRTDRDMEYVHLKDYRGSGVEPVNVLSRYKYQDGLSYYEETRDVASHFFIDYLPKGTYVFEYPVRVQLRGRYTSGVAEIQCMYAPEFNSHSESVPLVVE